MVIRQYSVIGSKEYPTVLVARPREEYSRIFRSDYCVGVQGNADLHAFRFSHFRKSSGLLIGECFGVNIVEPNVSDFKRVLELLGISSPKHIMYNVRETSGCPLCVTYIDATPVLNEYTRGNIPHTTHNEVDLALLGKDSELEDMLQMALNNIKPDESVPARRTLPYLLNVTQRDKEAFAQWAAQKIRVRS